MIFYLPVIPFSVFSSFYAASIQFFSIESITVSKVVSL